MREGGKTRLLFLSQSECGVNTFLNMFLNTAYSSTIALLLLFSVMTYKKSMSTAHLLSVSTCYYRLKRGCCFLCFTRLDCESSPSSYLKAGTSVAYAETRQIYSPKGWSSLASAWLCSDKKIATYLFIIYSVVQIALRA